VTAPAPATATEAVMKSNDTGCAIVTMICLIAAVAFIISRMT